MYLEQRGQNEIVGLPFASGLIRICRSSCDADERFARERVDRFPAPAILNGKYTEVSKIERRSVSRNHDRPLTILRRPSAAQKQKGQHCYADDPQSFHWIIRLLAGECFDKVAFCRAKKRN
jgi:hypothetical protein